MSAHQHEEGGVVKNFTTTAILTFVLVFVLFASFSKCHGPYEPNGHHEPAAAEQKAESHTEHH